jgi:hypothetical protein
MVYQLKAKLLTLKEEERDSANQANFLFQFPLFL